MNDPSARCARAAGARRLALCWTLAGVWLVATACATLSPPSPLQGAAAGIQFLALLLIVILHASLSIGWRGTLAFFAIVGLTAFTLEAISIATGFPFGFFEHYTGGPRALGVPLLVPTGYVMFGWLAWAQTQAILRAMIDARGGMLALIAAPLIGTFFLVGYDYPWDAIGATVLHIHSYRHPSGLFGVPLSNFIGWLVTGWCAFQIYALAERRFAIAVTDATLRLTLLPPLIWLGMALSYFGYFWTVPGGTASVAGRTFLIADIYEASAAISLPAMVMPALLAIVAVLAIRDRRAAG